MLISEINSAISLFSRAASWARHRQTSRKSLAHRFVQLFAAHGIHRNQIFRVLGVKTSLADIQTDESLLKIITDDLLEKAASLFAIRLEWLEGATNQIYMTHDFYKQSDRFPDLGSLRVGD